MNPKLKSEVQFLRNKKIKIVNLDLKRLNVKISLQILTTEKGSKIEIQTFNHRETTAQSQRPIHS